MITDWFEEYESLPIIDKSQIKWSHTKDFQVQGAYVVTFMRNAISNLESMDDESLLVTSQKCYNLISWSIQMAVMGFSGFQQYLDDLLAHEFDDKEAIARLQGMSFEKWLRDKEGFFKIGENYFTVINNNVYYRKLDGSQWRVKNSTVFSIDPVLEEQIHSNLKEEIETLTQTSVYEQIYSEWTNARYSGSPSASHFTIIVGESTPEKELDRSLSKINDIIEDPISLASVRSLGNLSIDDIERLIKLSFLMVSFTQARRNANEHTVYLLRDCAMFDEIHKTLDILDGRTTSSDRLIVGRDLLSNSKRRGGHWYFAQEALYVACEKYPEDFELFFREFSRILMDYEDYNEEFKIFLKRLACYVDEHISNAESKLPINFVDLGFQGSINILLKYVVENHSPSPRKHRVTIHMTIIAEWFKELYQGMYYYDTYSILTVVESLGRNELMYRYKLGSFDAGDIKVKMGTKEEQDISNTELLASTMVALISHKLNLV